MPRTLSVSSTAAGALAAITVRRCAATDNGHKVTMTAAQPGAVLPPLRTLSRYRSSLGPGGVITFSDPTVAAKAREIFQAINTTTSRDKGLPIRELSSLRPARVGLLQAGGSRRRELGRIREHALGQKSDIRKLPPLLPR